MTNDIKDDMVRNRARRKIAKSFMGGANRKHTEQFSVDGDPLPEKDEPVKRYLYSMTGEDGESWYHFADDPVEAGLHELTSDDDRYVDFIVDLDTSEHIRVEAARGFYVQRGDEYKFPQPEPGFVRAFFYVDVTPSDLETITKPIVLVNDDITHPFAATRLEGVQSNIEDAGPLIHDN